MSILKYAPVVAVVLLTATPAYAQFTRPERPYRGLFGGGYGSSEQMLSLGASFGGGYDSNVLLGQTGDPNAAASKHTTASTTADATLNLSYSLSKKTVSFSAGGYSSFSYYPDLVKSLYTNNGLNASGGFQISSRSSLTFSQTAVFSPLSLQSTLYALTNPTGVFGGSASSNPGQSLVQDIGAPADLIPAPVNILGPNAGALYENYTTLGTTVAFSYQLAKRVTSSLNYGHYQSLSPSHRRDLQSDSAAGRVSVALTQGLSAHFGYGYSMAHYSTGVQQVPSHNIDIGLDFSRALTVSLSRKTSFSASMGSSIISDGHQSHFFVTGNAALNHEIGRSWSASISFNRSVNFVAGFTEPVVSDGLSAGFGGLVSRKIQFHSSAGLSHGTVGVQSTGNNTFTAYQASAGLQFGLTHSLALGINYTYSKYTFDGGVSLQGGLSQRSDRQSIRASLSLWEPLFHRTRSHDAAR